MLFASDIVFTRYLVFTLVHIIKTSDLCVTASAIMCVIGNGLDEFNNITRFVRFVVFVCLTCVCVYACVGSPFDGR